jgi:hypothetical protein
MQVFPDALSRNMDALRGKALRKLQKCGIGNLRFLCERAKVTYAKKAGLANLAKVVLAAAPEDLLIYVMEFSRPREQSILEQYDAELSEVERAQHEADIEQLSNDGHEESLRVLTKLLLLYLRDPNVLMRIQYRHLWRSARTTAEFEADDLPDDAGDRLDAAADKLVSTLKLLPDGKKMQYVGSHELELGPRVFVLRRGLRQKISPEYPNKYHVADPYCHSVFGISENRRLVVKVGHQKFVQVVRTWAEQTLSLPLRAVGLSAFEDYDATELEKKLLGHYSEEHGLAVIGVRFHRTGLPNHPALTVEAAYGKTTVRDALAWYLEKGALSIRSLTDIEWLRIHFQGVEGKVDVTVDPAGSVRFLLDDAGWTEEQQKELGKAFQATFGIPLEQRVSPKPLKVGALEIYQSLLEWGNLDEIQSHQRELFEDLTTLSATS